MRLKLVIGALVLAAAGTLALGSEGRAADLGPLYAPAEADPQPEQPLAFGTGWYLRGDASTNFADDLRFDLDAGRTSFHRSTSDIGYGFGGGVGYKLNSFLRFDVTGDYLSPRDEQIDAACGLACDTALKTSVSRWDGLANGYLDLGTWAGITPYIGAGVGVSGTRQQISATVLGRSVTLSDIDPAGGKALQDSLTRTDYQFAWAAMAGFSYALDPHLLLDVGYRYLDLGRSTVPATSSVSYKRDMSVQQVRAGLRYMID